MNKLRARLSAPGRLCASLSVGKLTVLPSLQNKQVQPSTASQTVTYDEPYDGLASVLIDGVNHQIDPNILPQNIVKDVEILGVKGTAEPPIEFEIYNADRLFNGRENLVDAWLPRIVKTASMYECFYGHSTHSFLDLSHIDFSTCKNWAWTFYNFRALEEVIGLDFSAGTSFSLVFGNCRGLKRILFKQGSTIAASSTTSSVIIEMTQCSSLTDAALLEMAETLGANTTGLTRGFKLESTVKASLSQATKDAFAAKNYILS